jgi:hypothetical protein
LGAATRGAAPGNRGRLRGTGHQFEHFVPKDAEPGSRS